MNLWNSSQYLKFANERTQPSIDLVSRIALNDPKTIIDLGCGPGNSTAVVARRWPQAALTGLDNSANMLTTARQNYPQWSWQENDIGSWSAQHSAPYDLIFSNAALHWVPDHATALPRIFSRVAAGGALAFQMPHSLDSLHQNCMRALPDTGKWQGRFLSPPAAWLVESVGFYYDLFAGLAARVDIWLTDYVYVFDGPEGIVEWHKGAALLPFLKALPDDSARTDFIADYLAAITPHYPRHANGKVLLPFRRLFVVAYR
jgi:trans-aconitate 2-methyltransferase